MSKFALYNIVLKDIKSDKEVFEFQLDDSFFKKIDSPEVQKGNVKVVLTVVNKSHSYELQFILDGVVVLPCDRCLDDMEQPITYKDKLQVKFGATFGEEGDIVIVPQHEGAINIAWFLYEFIVLSVPLKHVHATGECNKGMTSKLKRHISKSKDGDDDDDVELDIFESDDNNVDPRWEGLQNILDN